MSSLLSSSSDNNVVSSMGLQNLQHEPIRLASEASRINIELESLVMENYRVFVENLTCSVHLKSKDKKLSEVANELGDKLNQFSQQCSTFRDRVNVYVNTHKRNRKTLQYHMQLVELLEVPQLVDACVRNGFHEEALELANFVNGLERRHLLASEVRAIDGNERCGSNVVQSIVDDVHTTLNSLRYQLLNLLTENSSLPKELQILDTLRKLDSLVIERQLEIEKRENELLTNLTDKQREILKQHFLKLAETRLQMDFLESRSIWLQSCIMKAMNGESQNNLTTSSNESIDNKNDIDGNGNNNGNGTSSVILLGSYGKAMEVIEINRLSFFSIITQFEALFEGTIEGTHSNTDILGGWVCRQTNLLLADLQTLLPNIEEGASIRSVLEQTLFLSDRLSILGCDLTNLIMPLFKNIIMNRLSSDWKNNVDNFKTILATERFNIEIDDTSKEQIIPLFFNQEQTEENLTFTNGNKGNKNDEIPYPVSLMSYPPLAFLLNSILIGFNFVRECPINNIRDIVLSELSKYLIEAVDCFIKLSNDINKRGMKYLSNKSNDAQIQSISMDILYSNSFMFDIIPHILCCYDQIYPSNKKFNADISKVIYPLKIDSLLSAQNYFSHDLYILYEKIYIKLESSKLILPATKTDV
jgi:hypothetical protein